jgi:methyl-accepting chemotaxis protein
MAETFESNQTAIRADMLTTSERENNEIEARMAANHKRMDDLWQSFRGAITTPEMQALSDQLAEQRKTWRPLEDEIMRLALSNQNEQAYGLLKSKGEPLAQKLEATIDKLVKTMVAQAEKTSDENLAVAENGVRTMLGALLVGVLVAAGLGLLIAREISRPLEEAARVLEMVAGGDLTVRLDVQSHDEVGRMATGLNRALESLRGSLAAIGENSQTLAASSEELSTVSQQMSSNAEESSAQVSTASAAAEEVSRNAQTVAAGTDELTASIGEIAQSTAEATRIVAGAVEVAQVTTGGLWPSSARAPSRSATSSRSSLRSPSRPIFSRSMPRSRRPAPAKRARDSRWWRTR